MKFVWLNKQGVASDQGFVVQCMERYAFEYREANRIMRLGGEAMYGELEGASFGFFFYSGWRVAKWTAPYEAVQISDTDRERIVQNIKDAFAFMNGIAKFDLR